MSERRPSHLAVKIGQYAAVKKLQEGLKLCAVDYQDVTNNAPLTYIWTKEKNNKKQMAFAFKHGKNSYILANKIGSLQLEKKESPSNPCHWFQKTDSGGGRHYTLQSVVKPQQYLATECRNDKIIFCLRDTGPVQVTEEN